MRVVLCEDDFTQKKFIHDEIKKYASFHEPSIEIVVSASQPDEVLAYLERHQADCYFLDIELNHRLDGMDVAMKIREKDPLATIIFITTHADRLKLTFTYKLAALDFIVKDTCKQLSTQVIEALQAAFEKYKRLGISDQTATVQIKTGELIKNIKIQDIYFIETSITPHKLALHEKRGYYEFYGKLTDYENLDDTFYRCHKSFIINLQHIENLNKKDRSIMMANGAVCPVSFRLFSDLQRRLVKFD